MNLRKKFVAYFLAIVFTGNCTLFALAQAFSDVSPSYWAYNPIISLSSQNIISGYSDNTFRPDNPVTRAEFSTMIIKTLGKENIPASRSFNFRDVSSSYWASDNIDRAYSLGLIRGFPDGTFRPNDFVSKTELLAIVASAAQTGTLSEAEARNILSRYYDGNKVPAWAVIPVAKAARANLAVNYPQPNFLMPDKRVSRAEVAATLYNLRQSLGMAPAASTQGQIPQQQQQQSYQQPATAESITQAAASGAATNIVLRGSIATIQQNSVIPTSLVTPLSSEVASVGDPVIVKVNSNVTTNQGTLLIPAGSQINGSITAVTPAKLANRNARMMLRFTSITLPNGQSAPLSASVATETGAIESGSLKGKIGKGVLTTIGGAGAGAALGTALGAITGNTGKGAIYGTAIGGGLGAVGAVLAKGGPINIPSGEPLFIKLDSPLNVDVNSGTIIQ